MSKTYPAEVNWKLYSRALLAIFLLVQLLRWRVSPQFIDIYYHLLTAWGFLQAGGYSGWDFWHYAPVGRMHIYPPLFHLILVFFIKLGLQKILLIKILEIVLPVALLGLIQRVISARFSPRLAFLVLLFIGSSFSFYLSLINYLPATLAMIFGFLCFDRMLRRNFLPASLFLALCFYTHIGISYFFALSFILYGLFRKEERRAFVLPVVYALVLAAPVLFKQAAALKVISVFGVSNENNFCEFKVIESILGLAGLALAVRMRKDYWLFVSFFLASFIFLVYPYRFFSAQGYLPLVFLAAVAADFLYNKFTAKIPQLQYPLFITLVLYCLYFSPTLMMNPREEGYKKQYTVYVADSVLANTFFGQPHERIATLLSEFPQKELLSAASIIEAHSQEGDIVSSEIYSIGVTLASLSGRATANRLFPEIKASKEVDPLAVSTIIVFLQDIDPVLLNSLQRKYDLQKIGENRLFTLYKNPACRTKAHVKQASISFGGIAALSLVILFLYLGSFRLRRVFESG